MESVLDRLEEHEARARVVVERLRQEAARVAGKLASADELLSRLVITRETVLEVLGERRSRILRLAVRVGAGCGALRADHEGVHHGGHGVAAASGV
jgi:hypothetical protein